MTEGFLSEALARALERGHLAAQTPNPRGFREVLLRARGAGRPALVFEFKRCSPRGFVAYMTPWEFHRIFERAADAYSVLVEPYWFCGSLELLPWFSRFKSVLAKDLTASEAQLEAYRSWGASAALLILDMLGWRRLEELYEHARSLGLDIVIEVSRGEDAVEAMNSYPESVVGVNARDLKSLKLDFEAALRELEKASAHKPQRGLLMAESGIDSPLKAVKAVKVGADALLIGTWAMKKPLEAARLREALAHSLEGV
ncbi:MAG: hypothetical protein F7B17_01805 [Desulfurococcales archaeon]|nr:hypothetical protein [Desulfurococcales archaeon]